MLCYAKSRPADALLYGDQEEKCWSVLTQHQQAAMHEQQQELLGDDASEASDDAGAGAKLR